MLGGGERHLLDGSQNFVILQSSVKQDWAAHTDGRIAHFLFVALYLHGFAGFTRENAVRIGL
jgi:hypothetical protein